MEEERCVIGWKSMTPLIYYLGCLIFGGILILWGFGLSLLIHNPVGLILTLMGVPLLILGLIFVVK